MIIKYPILDRKHWQILSMPTVLLIWLNQSFYACYYILFNLPDSWLFQRQSLFLFHAFSHYFLHRYHYINQYPIYLAMCHSSIFWQVYRFIEVDFAKPSDKRLNRMDCLC